MPRTYGQLTPARIAGRLEAADVVRISFAEEGSYASGARALGVNEKHLRACADRSAAHQLHVADVLTLASYGHTALASRLWREVELRLEERAMRMRLGFDRVKHAARILTAAAAAGVTAIEGDDAGWVRAVETVRKRCDEARRDLAPERGADSG